MFNTIVPITDICIKKLAPIDQGIIPGEIVLCLSDFYRTMEVEILDVIPVLVEEQVQTHYLFQDVRKVPSLVGIGKLSAVEDGGRYHIQAMSDKKFWSRSKLPVERRSFGILASLSISHQEP